MKIIRIVLFVFAIILFGDDVQGQSLSMPNMSCRTWVGKGEETLIGGFVLYEEHRVLIRAIGPSLAQFGVANVCPDPRLRLLRDGQQIATNDNWSGQDTAQSFARVGAFPLVAGSRDSAIVMVLPSGRYDAVVEADVEGFGLLEIYDLDIVAGGFSNLSVRTVIRPGGGLVIPGVVISGVGTGNFMFRAIGPGLRQFGIQGYVPDPRMTVRASIAGTPVYTFPVADDWGGGPGSDIYFTRIGAFGIGANARDAVFILPISFNGVGSTQTFTSTVEGVDGCSGVVLIEVWRY